MEQHYDFRKVAGNNMHIKIGIPRTCEKNRLIIDSIIGREPV